MNLTQERPIVESRLVDYYLRVGIAAEALAKATVHSRYVVEIRNGRLEISLFGRDPNIMVGTYGVEPAAEDWERAVSSLLREGASP